jgi:hypothetical protein
VDRHLPPATGLYRRGVLEAEQALLLAFHFPDRAEARHGAALAAIAAETGLTVRLKPEPHMGELARRAAAALPAGVAPLKPPSIRLDTREVGLKVAPGVAVDPAAGAAFEAETGFRLALEAQVQAPAALRGGYDAAGRLEINAALAAIEAAFAGEAHAPRKKSKRADAAGPYIELSFVSHAVALRYADLAGQLELDTGWNIRLGTSADQAAILQAVRELVPAGWEQAKAPGLHLADGVVAVRVRHAPPPAEAAAAAAALRERTGFELRLEVG